jgi:hypothetical protein
MTEVVEGYDYVVEVVGWVGIGLMPPLAQRWLLPLLLLVKDVDGILQLCEPRPLSVDLLSISFDALSNYLPSHDGFLFLLEPLYFLLDPDQLLLLYCGFIFFSFLIPVLHLDLIKLVAALKNCTGESALMGD